MGQEGGRARRSTPAERTRLRVKRTGVWGSGGLPPRRVLQCAVRRSKGACPFPLAVCLARMGVQTRLGPRQVAGGRGLSGACPFPSVPVGPSGGQRHGTRLPVRWLDPRTSCNKAFIVVTRSPAARTLVALSGNPGTSNPAWGATQLRVLRGTYQSASPSEVPPFC